MKDFLIDRITSLARLRDPQPANLEDMKRLWTEIAATDTELARFLESTMLRSKPVVEINIADSDRRIVTSSISTRKEHAIEPHPALSDLAKPGPIDRLLHVLAATRDYEVRIPIGAGQLPVLEIQLLVSPALIRETLEPQMRTTALISGPLNFDT